MHVFIARDLFLKALTHGQNIVERRTTIPILSHVLLKAEGEKLILTTTDMEISIVESMEAKIQREGSAAVPVRMLHDVVRRLKEGAEIDLNFDAVKGILTLTSGKSQFTFPCLSPEEFPVINIQKLPHGFSLPAKDMLKLLEGTRFAICQDETRYSLSGVYLHEIQGKEMRAVATDGHRLAKVTLALPETAKGIPGVIIPRKTVQEIIRLLGDTLLDVDVTLSDSQISFNIGDAFLTSRLVDAQYPDYEPVIPKANDKCLALHVKPFSEALDRVSLMAPEKERGIKMKLSQNRLQLFSTSVESGTASEELEVDYAQDPLEIGFNARYLLEIVQQIQSKEAEILLSDVASPAIIRDLKDVHTLYVLMPMRV